MVGRGVAVSKSDIATYAFAMLALEKCGAALSGAVELHVTYDEEEGGEIGPRCPAQDFWFHNNYYANRVLNL
jgi:succinyl-diaminopimelate desuccinylase